MLDSNIPTLAESIAARKTANSAAPPEVYSNTQELLIWLTQEDMSFTERVAVSAQVITRMFTYRSAFGITAEQFQGIPRSLRRFLPVERRLVQRTRKDTDGTKLALVDTIRLYENDAATSAVSAMVLAGYTGGPVADEVAEFLKNHAIKNRALYLG